MEPEPHLLNNLDKITLKRTPISSRHHNGTHSSELDMTDTLMMMDESDVMRRARNSTASDNFLPNEHPSIRLTPRPFATPDSRRDFDAPIDNDLGDADMNLDVEMPIDFPTIADFELPQMDLAEGTNGMEEGMVEPPQEEPPVPITDTEGDPPVNGLEKGELLSSLIISLVHVMDL